jgi:hypothetical protein
MPKIAPHAQAWAGRMRDYSNNQAKPHEPDHLRQEGGVKFPWASLDNLSGLSRLPLGKDHEP